MSSSRAALGVLLPTVVALATVAGCGTAEPQASSTAALAPRDAVQAGVTALLRGSDVTMTLRLDTTAEALLALAATPGQQPMTKAQANALADGSLRSALHVSGALSGSDILDPTKAITRQGTRLAYTVNDGSGDVVEVRGTEGALYGRADVHHLADLADDPSQARVEVAAASAGVGIPSAYKQVVAAGINGDWLGLRPSTVQTDASLLHTMLTQPNTFSALGNDLQQRMIDYVVARARVTRVDSHAGTDHLRATLSLQELSDGFTDAIAGSVRAMYPSSDAPEATPEPERVPAQDEFIDVYTHNGVLSEIRLDVAADLVPNVRANLHGKPLAVDIRFDTSPVEVTAPTSATLVDPTPLLKTLQAAQAAQAR